MIGKDTYMESVIVHFGGPVQAKTEAMQSAYRMCASQGKQVMLDSLNSHMCGLPGGCGEAEITFFCLSEDDPRYQANKLRSQPNTVIQNTNIQNQTK
jgi:hypothetical protein